jgi:hypothetical protein
MSHYQYKDDFEKRTGYKVKRVVVEDGDEVYIIETEIGGHDEEGFYLVVQDGPAQGEKGYL